MQILSDADDEISFLTAEAQAGGRGVQLNDPQQFVGLVPYSDGAVCAAGGKQTHLLAAGKAGDVIGVVVVGIVVETLCKVENASDTRNTIFTVTREIENWREGRVVLERRF